MFELLEVPILLQGGVLRELLDKMDNLIPLVIFIGAALFPALKQARDRKKEKARREAQRTSPFDSEDTEPTPAASQSASTGGASELEERVKRYFETLGQGSGGTQGASTQGHSPPAARPTQRSSSPTLARTPAAKRDTSDESHSTLVDLTGLDSEPRTGFEGLHIQLQELTHHKRRPLPSRMPRARRRRKKKPAPGALSHHHESLRSLLRDPHSLRQAIVLREILGPPKGLETQEGR